MVKDNIHQIFLEKIISNSFNIFIFIYFKNKKLLLLKHVYYILNKKLKFF